MTRAASPLTQHVSAVPLSSVLFLHNETKGRVGVRLGEGEGGGGGEKARKERSRRVFLLLWRQADHISERFGIRSCQMKC